ncbi:hypothetical protein FOZ61_007789 [Perkinsus olseni]|uniref:Uncharacterized protein n=1 Tax=Perkinsus olseni TaxID=32597 RepID=A0A7J6L788_PEROL|nr:hypothetical protein FOZ61_007789 [Perkinsus olseni]KAF4658195.1 hypothetical protein FOL46_007070 [Perkinsus olseni]
MDISLTQPASSSPRVASRGQSVEDIDNLAPPPPTPHPHIRRSVRFSVDASTLSQQLGGLCSDDEPHDDAASTPPTQAGSPVMAASPPYQRSTDHGTQTTEESEDEDENERSCSSVLSKVFTLVLPFRIFKYPETAPWSLVNGHRHKLHTRKQEGVRGLFVNVLVVLTLLLGATQVLVFACFSFASESEFPSYGENKSQQLKTVLLVTSVITILALYVVCFFCYKPNYQRIHDHGLLHHEELNPAGVFQFLRKCLAFVRREEFVPRWFTTFLSDHILLFIVWVCYVTYQIMRISSSPFGWYTHLLSIYQSVVKSGVLVYMLEYSPVVVRRRSLIATAVIILIIGLQLTEFFVLIYDKNAEEDVERTFGSGAQLFMTHSAIMFGAIVLGHHMHPGLCPDLQPLGLLKLAGVGVVVAVFAWYCFTREFDHAVGRNQDGWVTVSYPYVLSSLQIAGGLLVLLLLWFWHINRHPQKKSFVKRSTSFAWGVPRDELDIDPDSSSPFDYDVSLVVIALIVSNLYYLSEINAAGIQGRWTTFAVTMLSVVAPIALTTFSVVLWRWPPTSRTIFRGGLLVALTLALCLLFNAESAEDCHLNGTVPSCCVYPWFEDVNDYFEKKPDAPGCSGTYSPDGECVSLVDQLENGTHTGIISVSYDYKYSRELVFQTVQLDDDGTETTVFEKVYPDVSSPAIVVCVEESGSIGGQDLKAGCSGLFEVAVSEATDLQGCRLGFSPEGASCLVKVYARNCAYTDSYALEIFPLIEERPKETIRKTENWVTKKEYSRFYDEFLLVGMAAALELFFTLAGILLKIFILTDSKFFPEIHRLNLNHGVHKEAPVRKRSSRGSLVSEMVQQERCSVVPVESSKELAAILAGNRGLSLGKYKI